MRPSDISAFINRQEEGMRAMDSIIDSGGNMR